MNFPPFFLDSAVSPGLNDGSYHPHPLVPSRASFGKEKKKKKKKILWFFLWLEEPAPGAEIRGAPRKACARAAEILLLAAPPPLYFIYFNPVLPIGGLGNFSKFQAGQGFGIEGESRCSDPAAPAVPYSCVCRPRPPPPHLYNFQLST